MKIANEEAQERESKLAQIKLERDIKEKEAAAHLVVVEEKAARVDELEKQMVLLNMDKERLQREVHTLSDQLVSGLDAVADNTKVDKKSKLGLLSGGFTAFNPMATSQHDRRRINSVKKNNHLSVPKAPLSMQKKQNSALPFKKSEAANNSEKKPSRMP